MKFAPMLITAALVGALTLGVVPALHAQDVRTDYDHHADFAQF